jgi:beta-D-xylosidase 4
MVPAVVDLFEGGQAAGTAAGEMLFGDFSPSGMMPFAIYPDDYVTKVKMSDMYMRPNATSGSPGHTYRFYTGEVQYPFGFGLAYTTFSHAWGALPAASQPAATLQSDGTVRLLSDRTSAPMDSIEFHTCCWG